MMQNRFINDANILSSMSRQPLKQLTTPPQIDSSKNFKQNPVDENPQTFGGSKIMSPFTTQKLVSQSY